MQHQISYARALKDEMRKNSMINKRAAVGGRKSLQFPAL